MDVKIVKSETTGKKYATINDKNDIFQDISIWFDVYIIKPSMYERGLTQLKLFTDNGMLIACMNVEKFYIEA